MTYSTEVQKGQVTYINGEKVTITDTNDTFCVTVTDSKGNQMSVRRSTLMSTPLFNFEKIKEDNKRRIEEFQVKAKEYEQAQETAYKEQRNFLAKIDKLFKQAGTRIKSQFNSEQRELYDTLKKDYWGAVFSATSAGNRAYSCYMSAFDAAHDNAMLSSQIC